MKKRLICLLLTAVLLLSAAPLAWADTALTTEQDVLDLFARQKQSKAETFEFTCSSQLYEALMADSAALLKRLEIKGGISDARIRYNEGKHLIELSRVEYSDVPWVECATEKEACLAVQQMLKDGEESFTILCSGELCQKLSKSGALKNAAARIGMESLRLSYYTNGIIQASEPKKFTMDYAVVEDAAQFNAAIEDFAQRELTEFYIVYTQEMFDRITSDAEQRDLLHVPSMLDRYNYSSASAPGVLHYYGVKYTQEPCLVCRSEEDVVDAIARMGSLGIRAFRLYLADPDLRTALLDNSLARLHELEARAGLTSAKLSYTSKSVFYAEAEIVADAVSFDTVEEARAYVEEQSALGAEEITLFCAPELYEMLMGKLGGFVILQDGMDPIYDLICHAGIFDYELSANRSTGAIMIHVKAYYPGTEILRATEAGKEASLSPRLKETLETARKMAEDCRGADPLETARKIHDALCEAIVYTDDEETDEDDTAVGALLNGEANCDGYADAFYLVGTLAGLDVRYQHGDSLVKGYGIVGLNAITHMWNLLKIDGTWRLVDVTWDDEDEDGQDYTWFNLGEDRASRTHLWNKEMTMELLAETDLSCRPENEYAVGSREELEKAVSQAMSSGQKRFSLIFDKESYADYQAALELVRQAAAGSYSYSWGEELRQLRVTMK